MRNTKRVNFFCIVCSAIEVHPKNNVLYLIPDWFYTVIYYRRNFVSLASQNLWQKYICGVLCWFNNWNYDGKYKWYNFIIIDDDDDDDSVNSWWYYGYKSEWRRYQKNRNVRNGLNEKWWQKRSHGGCSNLLPSVDRFKRLSPCGKLTRTNSNSTVFNIHIAPHKLKCLHLIVESANRSSYILEQ